ncbi:energy-coupling factor transport system ATP-binding protein [Pararhizobium capsulatum DSM 1112]|uniref:Energy-coupling factor transport system ATP-binding protein n=1 Tax=Pararhizobium capsulatum DSM 1112 TaxID=1121113 RepID=A0ABU0BWA8_9HYPH|nr:ABC transporter ATP-binding protein [Pararhizobium capsulatum]MDQ0321984.1 energy-coupling factor transport system ATP-binding protein [Pararhizobium capsulatum DSM 1112]
MLTLENLSFAHHSQTPLFSGLNASVGEGQVLAVVGRNGAGKSTLLRLLNGLLRPQSGHVLLRGKAIDRLKVHEIAAEVGTLFQAPEQQLFAARLSDEVAFGPKQLQLSAAEITNRVDEALAQTFLTHRASHHPLDLSAAERRFTALASILAMRPAVLLLDEPQRGLDRIWTERLEGIISKERDEGKSIVLICHDMNFAERNAQSVLALGGRQPIQLSTEDFFADAGLLRETSVERPMRLQLKSLLEIPDQAPRVTG